MTTGFHFRQDIQLCLLLSALSWLTTLIMFTGKSVGTLSQHWLALPGFTTINTGFLISLPVPLSDILSAIMSPNIRRIGPFRMQHPFPILTSPSAFPSTDYPSERLPAAGIQTANFFLSFGNTS